MMIEAQDEDLEMKVEAETYEVVDTLKPLEPKKSQQIVDLDAVEGPSKKRVKLDYTSDNSQSQQSVIDVNETAMEGGEVKEHGSKVRKSMNIIFHLLITNLRKLLF